MYVISKIILSCEKTINRIIFKRRHVNLKGACSIYGILKIYNSGGKINIGSNCIFRSGTRTNPLGGASKLILAVGKDGCIQIGNHVGISNSCLRINTELIIEDDVNIGGDCKIYDSDMHSVEYTHRMESPDKHIKMAPICIKKGAWIGAHSIILKGVTIGERSVIGAASVVTKNVPNDEIWAGNPARFIKKIDQ